MPDVTLKAINHSNWRQCVALQAPKNQQATHISTMESLVQAAYEPSEQLVPLGVYAGDQMVGFVMYATPTHNGSPIYAIPRLMIDRKYQDQGYDRAALEAVIKRLVAMPDCDSIFASYVEGHVAMADLYESMGFQDEGMRSEDTVIVRLVVR